MAADYRGDPRTVLNQQLASLANGDVPVVGLRLGRGYTQEVRRDGSQALYLHGRLIDSTPAPTPRIEIEPPKRSG